jgi:mono/diheme cytochrome c family protein
LRKQAESRGLEGPFHQGRIYRIAPEGGAGRPEAVRLAGATAAELAERLTHPNGWVRDTAQRLLVEGAGGRAAAAELRRLARSHPEMTARLHALWTLEGLGELNRDAILSSLSDASPKVRAAGLRLAEASLRVLDESPGLNALRDAVVALSNDASVEVRRQLALTLGVIAYGPSIKQTLAGLSESKSPGVKAAAEFSLGLREPKKSQAPAVAKGRPLTREEQARFEMGRGVYEATCIACHQPHGLGQEGLAPPLVDTEWIQSSPERLSRMVLHGIRGKMMVKGQEYELDMPSLAVLDDDQIAAVLTYVRREWGHAYDPVDPATVKKARAETADRVDAWTAEELLKIP